MPSPARLLFQRSELSRQEEFRELFGDVAESQPAGPEDDLIAEFRSEDEDSSAEEDGEEDEEEEHLGTQVRYRRCDEDEDCMFDLLMVTQASAMI